MACITLQAVESGVVRSGAKKNSSRNLSDAFWPSEARNRLDHRVSCLLHNKDFPSQERCRDDLEGARNWLITSFRTLKTKQLPVLHFPTNSRYSICRNQNQQSPTFYSPSYLPLTFLLTFPTITFFRTPTTTTPLIQSPR